MKKYIAAAVLLSVALAAGCSGNSSSQPESTQPDKSTTETAEAAPAAQPTEPAAGTTETGQAHEQTEVTTAPQTAPEPQETTVPEENAGGYIADWIYGTWSAVSINGQEYWDYAFSNGLTEQAQLVFDSDGNVIAAGGEDAGVVEEYTYQITDEGADIYYSFGEKTASLVYDPATDTMTASVYSPEGGTVVLKRGEYPQPEAGMDYIADWIYGTWSMISVDGTEFWTWADSYGIDAEYKLNFTFQGVETLTGDDIINTAGYRITDDGAEIRENDGTAIPVTYSPAEDTLSFTMDEHACVMKRGTNPRPAVDAH